MNLKTGASGSLSSQAAPPPNSLVPSQTLAAFTNALMSGDPLLQKSALAAAQQQQHQAAVAALLGGAVEQTKREATSPASVGGGENGS